LQKIINRNNKIWYCQKFYEKKADATPRRSNRRNCWSLVSNERKSAQFIAPVKYRSRKVRLFKNEPANFYKDANVRAECRGSAVLQQEALSRHKTGIKPLPAVAFYTVLTVDKTSALKCKKRCSEKQKILFFKY
jgi:hypothetical protein